MARRPARWAVAWRDQGQRRLETFDSPNQATARLAQALDVDVRARAWDTRCYGLERAPGAPRPTRYGS